MTPATDRRKTTEIQVRPHRDGYEVATVHVSDRRSTSRSVICPTWDEAEQTADFRLTFWERLRGVGNVRIVIDTMLGGPE